MASYTTCLPILLVMTLCLVLVKFHSLSVELERRTVENKRLVAEVDAFREKNLALDQRIMKESKDRGATEIKWRDCVREGGKQRTQLTDANNELSNEVEELQRQLTLAKNALNVREQELVKVAEEKKKCQDLYEETNVKLNELGKANEDMKKIADAAATRAKELQAEVLQAKAEKPEGVAKREAGDATEKAKEEKRASEAPREEPKKENSPAAKTTPSAQEQKRTEADVDEQQQQQQEQEEQQQHQEENVIQEAVNEERREEEAKVVDAEEGQLNAGVNDEEEEEVEDEEEGDAPGDNARQRGRRSMVQRLEALRGRVKALKESGRV